MGSKARSFGELRERIFSNISGIRREKEQRRNLAGEG